MEHLEDSVGGGGGGSTGVRTCVHICVAPEHKYLVSCLTAKTQGKKTFLFYERPVTRPHMHVLR